MQPYSHRSDYPSLSPKCCNPVLIHIHSFEIYGIEESVVPWKQYLYLFDFFYIY